MNPPAPAIPVISSIAPLAADTEAWLVDIWGVLHNGVTPFEGAAGACQAFRARGGIVLLLSNAPRPGETVAAGLDRVGVPRSAWDAIVSSGDAARRLIEPYNGRAIFHLGPQRDLGIYGGLAVELGTVEDAEAVCCTGLFDDETEAPDDYRAMLEGLLRRQVPMICANPDIKVERGSKIIWCAGAIAELYERLGGHVTYAGKPHLPIYEMAFGEIDRLAHRRVARERILAIGDGLRTDIDGALTAGVAAVYIASGVHMTNGAGLDAAVLDVLFPELARRPIAAMAKLVW